MSLVLAIDCDGTLVEKTPGPMRWRPGARDALFALKRAGHTLVLFSARNTPRGEFGTLEARSEVENFYMTGAVPPEVDYQWKLFDEMRAFLQREGVWELFEVWQAPGKPLADLFIDDLAELPDWNAITREFGVQLRKATATS